MFDHSAMPPCFVKILVCFTRVIHHLVKNGKNAIMDEASNIYAQTGNNHPKTLKHTEG